MLFVNFIFSIETYLVKQTVSGNIAIHAASLYSNNDVVEMLLDNGGDVSMMNGKTPLDYALKKSYQTIVKMLDQSEKSEA